MVKASKGSRRRTRGIMRRPARERGLSPITRSFQEFGQGEKANIVIDPSIHRGQPHVRFHGRTGEVVGRRGGAYILSIDDKGKRKTAIVRPEHLRKVSP